MKFEIESDAGSKEEQKLIRWFQRWGHRKWQFVFFHQLLIIGAWNVYWFFKDHELSLYPLDGAKISKIIFGELPVLAVGIIFWSIMKVRAWESYAYRVGIQYRHGRFPVKETGELEDVVKYTESRIKTLSAWHRRWSSRKWLFVLLNTSFLFLLIILGLVGIKIWQRGNAWINSFYPSAWPVYVLLIG